MTLQIKHVPLSPKVKVEIKFDALRQNLMFDVKFWPHRCVPPLNHKKIPHICWVFQIMVNIVRTAKKSNISYSAFLVWKKPKQGLSCLNSQLVCAFPPCLSSEFFSPANTKTILFTFLRPIKFLLRRHSWCVFCSESSLNSVHTIQPKHHLPISKESKTFNLVVPSFGDPKVM